MKTVQESAISTDAPQPALRRWRRLLHSPRLTVPAMYFALLMTLFSIQRFVEVMGHRDRLNDVTGSQILRGFRIGLRFDLVAAAQWSLPLVIIFVLVASRWLSRRWFRWGVSALAATLLAFLTFCLVADFFFFREFDERLNHKALLYLDQPYTYRVMWHQYPVIPALLAALAMLAGVAWAINRLVFRRQTFDFSPAGRLTLAAVQAVVVFLCIRGSLGPKALNPGPAYFSNSPTLAQLTLNPLFTLYEASYSLLIRAESLKSMLPLLKEEDAFTLTQQLVLTPRDRLVPDARNPLHRITTSDNPQRNHNVVLVLLESLSWQYIGALGGNASLTPNFSKLIDQGVIFERCFAVGDRTTRGFSGVDCSFPDLPGRSVTTRIESVNNFLTVGHILRERGYQTAFIYAGQPMYDHRQSFLHSNGFERMIFEDQFDQKTFRTELGWCDGDLFTEVLAQCTEMSRRGPFLANMITLSFHRPFEFPGGQPPAAGEKYDTPPRQQEVIRYTDAAIGQFIDKARQQPWFDDTLFVFVADHTGGYAEHPLNFASNRVPFLIYAPKIMGPPRRIGTVVSQLDVAPTILSILGGAYEHCFFGSDALERKPEDGRAIMQVASELSYIDGRGRVATIPFGGGRTKLFDHTLPGTLTPVEVESDATRAERNGLANRGIAMLQTAEAIYERGAYMLPQYKDKKADVATNSAAGGATEE